MADAPGLTIHVDADACPVKAEIYRVANRYGVPVVLVSNAPFAVPNDPLVSRVIVSGSFDAADDWIAAAATPASIVVTADIPLAARCLEAGATVLGPTGKPFTKGSIGQALASRALNEHLRAMGELTGGPKPMAGKDKSRFLSALDEAIVKLRRTAVIARAPL